MSDLFKTRAISAHSSRSNRSRAPGSGEGLALARQGFLRSELNETDLL